jgi:hypothetical protein
MKTFETEYQLQEWRKIESQHFDSDGNAYKGQNMSTSTQEQMLKLINQLDDELSMTEQPLEKEVLEQMHLMCIESLSPENFTNWGSIKRSLIKDRKNLK